MMLKKIISQYPTMGCNHFFKPRFSRSCTAVQFINMPVCRFRIFTTDLGEEPQSFFETQIQLQLYSCTVYERAGLMFAPVFKDGRQ